ncbi:D-alanyl-D-alanine carboxypeptidase family protein [Bacillus sp. AFS040349]|uniref:D-alanyl-D-alanine carboxypeptidase family protein n=2 Tax=Bacillaceae TaxID=186817 RepID=UPI000BFC89B6|nr:D-alanyl-D-alanine carboxypeptidase family protein [Bacillus sp. AFS040349]PGT85341.1 D-alanyl-D-alanine carboxypeptidase [Bacillus sp. AFS040349]
MIKNKIKSVFFILLVWTIFIPNSISALENQDLPLYSESVILLDAQSGQTIYEKNSQVQVPPASITKIATAIYAIEKGHLEDIVTVSENARNVDGTRVYLEVDEQVPLIKLIQGLVINSGNDAGVAIAEHLSGTIDEFIIDFNSYLKEEIGVQHTIFKNPHGLYDPEHMTTAEDMAKITRYAMKNETFMEIFQTSELAWDGQTWDTTIVNHHEMVRDKEYEGISGGKNGFVQESGFTLVTTANREKISLIAVTLNAMSDNQAYEDTKTLLDYGFQNFETELVMANEHFKDNLDNRYVLNQDEYITKHIGEIVTKEVSAAGELEMSGDNGRSIKKITLTKIQSEQPNKKMESKVVVADEVKEKESGNKHLLLLVPFSLFLALFLSVFFYVQVRKTS